MLEGQTGILDRTFDDGRGMSKGVMTPLLPHLPGPAAGLWHRTC